MYERQNYIRRYEKHIDNRHLQYGWVLHIVVRGFGEFQVGVVEGHLQSSRHDGPSETKLIRVSRNGHFRSYTVSQRRRLVDDVTSQTRDPCLYVAPGV